VWLLTVKQINGGGGGNDRDKPWSWCDMVVVVAMVVVDRGVATDGWDKSMMR
jgi:hypothetical protein